MSLGPKDIKSSVGNLELLRKNPIAFLCSSTCPGSVILRALDWAEEVRMQARPIISGFHSSVEKKVLSILLRGTCPIIICPARGIGKMRIPAAWRKPMEDGRILIISPFDDKVTRGDRRTAEQRNAFVTGMSTEVLLAHVAPESSVDSLSRKLLRQGLIVMRLDQDQPVCGQL